MITKLIRFTVSEQDSPTFHSALQRVEEASKTESGCVHYSAFVNKVDAKEFTVLEIWDGEESLEAHRNSAHLATFKSECGEMITDKSSLELNPL